jgi:hypothetical protein
LQGRSSKEKEEEGHLVTKCGGAMATPEKVDEPDDPLDTGDS